MNNPTFSFDDTAQEKPNHICHVDCELVAYEKRGQIKHKHIMYSTSPTTAAGRYQYDRNREIYTMGKGARAAMRATGQGDTRTNREWNYGRKLWREARERSGRIGAARNDAEYRRQANEAFGPDHRPYKARRLRAAARMLKAVNPWNPQAVQHTRDALVLLDREGLASIIRPSYLAGSEHDPSL